MDEFLKGSTDAVALVLYLLPGFLGMAVCDYFVGDATWWLKDDNGVMTSIDVKGEGVYISDFSTVTAIALLS